MINVFRSKRLFTLMRPDGRTLFGSWANISTSPFASGGIVSEVDLLWGAWLCDAPLYMYPFGAVETVLPLVRYTATCPPYCAASTPLAAVMTDDGNICGQESFVHLVGQRWLPDDGVRLSVYVPDRWVSIERTGNIREYEEYAP